MILMNKILKDLVQGNSQEIYENNIYSKYSLFYCLVIQYIYIFMIKHKKIIIYFNKLFKI